MHQKFGALKVAIQEIFLMLEVKVCLSGDSKYSRKRPVWKPSGHQIFAGTKSGSVVTQRPRMCPGEGEPYAGASFPTKFASFQGAAACEAMTIQCTGNLPLTYYHGRQSVRRDSAVVLCGVPGSEGERYFERQVGIDCRQHRFLAFSCR